MSKSAEAIEERLKKDREIFAKLDRSKQAQRLSSQRRHVASKEKRIREEEKALEKLREVEGGKRWY